ncbi:hypothetical protein PsorP6_019126 [Peronosclerospora sorghi]|nr:hypothetical protein PsorP6_019126 [Peronosclerospora sorghi]
MLLPLFIVFKEFDEFLKSSGLDIRSRQFRSILNYHLLYNQKLIRDKKRYANRLQVTSKASFPTPTVKLRSSYKNAWTDSRETRSGENHLTKVIPSDAGTESLYYHAKSLTMVLDTLAKMSLVLVVWRKEMTQECVHCMKTSSRCQVVVDY